LLSDYIDFSPVLQLAGQLFLAALIVIFTCRLPADAAWFWISLIFWTGFIVGTANFYNFMDGINGIAGLTGVVGFALVAAYIYLTNKPGPLGEVALGISLACLGFLPFNVPRARVFMGDVGSILLGGAFGCLVYLAAANFWDFACLAAFLFPCYADELTTILVRLRDGERLTQAHRRHLYQLLANEKGWPHWQVSLGFGVLQLLVGLTVLWATLDYPGAVVVMLSMLCHGLCRGYLLCPPPAGAAPPSAQMRRPSPGAFRPRLSLRFQADRRLKLAIPSPIRLLSPPKTPLIPACRQRLPLPPFSYWSRRFPLAPRLPCKPPHWLPPVRRLQLVQGQCLICYRGEANPLAPVTCANI
jgi:hypothetical protein